jgi:hypothetical protein
MCDMMLLDIIIREFSSMIHSQHDRFIQTIIYSFLFFILTFVMTLVSYLYVAPEQDTISLSYVLLVVNLIIFSGVTFFLWRFLKHPKHHISVVILKSLLWMTLISLILYFVLNYINIYFLIDSTSVIMFEKILNGNPSLILTFTRINYQSLRFILTLMGSLNSPLILMIMLLMNQYLLQKTYHLTVEQEPEIQYDDFLYDRSIILSIVLLVVLSFLSINLFNNSYDTLGFIEMIVSMPLFLITVMMLIPTFSMFQTKYKKTTRSKFTDVLSFLNFMGIMMLFLGVILLAYNIAAVLLERSTYRLITSSLLFITMFYFWSRVDRIRSLNNH